VPQRRHPTPEPPKPFQGQALPIEELPPHLDRESTISIKLTRSEDPIIGIDFGTSYSSVGIINDNGLTLFPDKTGRIAIPSVVWFRGPGDYVVGQQARERLAIEPQQVIPSIKRLLGRQIDEPLAAPFMMSIAVPGYSGPNRSIMFRVNGEEMTPILVAAIILRHLKKMAEDHLGRPVRKAVLAYPLAFGEANRIGIKKAARIAGLEVVAMIPEPVAAAMAYGRHGNRNEIVGVYDFGGGTFDFCVLGMGSGKLQVLGAAGDPWLGGDDMDQAIAKWTADEFWKRTHVDVRKRTVEWQKVIQSCEEAKCYLSLVEEIEVFVPSVVHGEYGLIDLNIDITRERFDHLISEIIENSFIVSAEALRDAKLSITDIDVLLLTGGTTRVIAVNEAVRRYFLRDPQQNLHPEQAVVIGACLRGAEISGKAVSEGPWPSLTVQQVAGRTIGMAMAGGMSEPIIHRTTPLPAIVRRTFSTRRDGQLEIDIQIVEGESTHTSENTIVGRFNVSGLPPRPAGSVDVEIVFQMNDSGVLSITAKELTTGRRTTSTFDLGER
jgi:molecular chaperone DnaK